MKQKKNRSQLQYGMYASFFTAIVVVVVLVVNLLVGQMNWKFDLTKNQLYTLSEETVELLKSTQETVELYSVYPEGEELSVVTQILDRYGAVSSKVKVENIDPYTNPQWINQFAQQGETVGVGSVIVGVGGQYKIIQAQDMADIYTDQTTGTTYLTGIKLESVLTGTLRQMLSGETSKIYALTGHNEMAIEEDLIREMEYAGFTLEDLSLVTETAVPEDCEILLINAPTADLTERERTAIESYLQQGGSLFVTLGLTTEHLTNFEVLLANYGIAPSNRMVVEGSANFAYQQNPYYLVPSISNELELSKPLSEAKTSVLIPFGTEITLLETKRNSVEIATILESSPYASSQSLEEMGSGEAQVSAEATGPFALAVYITDESLDGTEDGTQIAVFSSETILESSINSVVNGGNYGLVMNTLDVLAGNDMVERSKSLGAEEYLQMNQTTAILMMFLCVIVLPVVILAAGVVVVIRRRNK